MADFTKKELVAQSMSLEPRSKRHGLGGKCDLSSCMDSRQDIAVTVIEGEKDAS